jgi:hypothetical protein
MAKYKVAICYEEGVTVYVDAKNADDAEQKAYALAEDYAGSSYPQEYNHNCVHRDYFTQDATKVGE